VELVQTDWPSGDYRARDVALDLSVDGKTWKQTARGTIPNRPGAILRLPLPQTPFTGFQLRFLNTHDRQAALSVGLSRVQFLSAGRIIETSDWKAEASSSYSGFSPGALLAGVKSPELPFRASLSPGELRALQQRRVRGKKLPILGVIYTRQVKSGARSHIAEIDQLCLWTWRPVDLKNLEANFQALEKLAPDKKLFLGCYMYDFNENKPMPVALMKGQVELAYRWLKEGRISGMIFLATPNVDVGLEAVDWTRRWIQEQGDRKLPASQ
jgi:hypothetical protein